MAGMDVNTGLSLEGVDHLAQSLGVLFTTPAASRVRRRHVHGAMGEMIDRPMHPANQLAGLAHAADAIARFEPRLRLRAITWSAPDPAMGIFGLTVRGDLDPSLGGGSVSLQVPVQ